jgi:hypothetical protein
MPWTGKTPRRGLTWSVAEHGIAERWRAPWLLHELLHMAVRPWVHGDWLSRPPLWGRLGCAQHGRVHPGK